MDCDVRALMFVKRFCAGAYGRWLTDELADALVRGGAEVEVAFLDLHDSSYDSFAGRHPIKVRRYPAGSKYHLRRGLAQKGPALVRAVARLHCVELARAVQRKFDILVVFSIASFFGFAPILMRRLGLAKRLVFVLWDFFPDHHVEIGVVPSRAAPALRPLERWTARSADLVCVMSEGNAKAAIQYFGISPERIVVVPPWGDALDECARVGAGRDRGEQALHLIFGGQTGKGRDLAWLLERVLLAREAGMDVHLSVVGGSSKELTPILAGYHGASQCITVLPWMDRPSYVKLLASADIGVVVTDERVSFPTFPSKLVDYFRVGLPVLACLEAASDVSILIEDNEVGFACDLGSNEAFSNVLRRMLKAKQQGDLEVLGNNARSYFAREMEVSVAARRMLSVAESSQG